MTVHRKPPLPESFTANRTPRGICRWCAAEIRDANGKLLARRRWHEDCLHRYYFLSRPAVTAWAVEARDGGVCADCGRRAIRSRHSYFYPDGSAYVFDTPPFLEADSDLFVGQWCAVWFEPDWQVDHIDPLWKSVGLRDETRLRFFELANLQTLCATPCHKRKSRREAAERAKWCRQIRKRNREAAPTGPRPAWL